MRRWKDATIVVAALCAAALAADDPKPDAARRAEIAARGRLAWIDRPGRVTISDLAGGGAVVSDVAHAEWVGWFDEGRRVAALAGNHVVVIDAATGKAVDLARDAKTGEQFVAAEPVLSPDGRRLAVWRCDVEQSRRRVSGDLAFAGLSVFDLDGAFPRADLAATRPGRHVDESTVDWGLRPRAWWTADGSTLYAAVGVDEPTLVRCGPDGSNPTRIAAVAVGRWISQVAPDGPSVALAVEDQHRLEIRDVAGKTLLLLDAPARCSHLAWTDDRTALLADVASPDAPPERLRIEPGRPPTHDASLDDGVHVPAAAPKWSVLARAPMDSDVNLRLTCRDLATGAETEIGRGRDVEAAGWIVVFLRRGRKAGAEFWAFDPQDGASVRLSERPADVIRFDVWGR